MLGKIILTIYVHWYHRSFLLAQQLSRFDVFLIASKLILLIGKCKSCWILGRVLKPKVSILFKVAIVFFVNYHNSKTKKTGSVCCRIVHSHHYLAFISLPIIWGHHGRIKKKHHIHTLRQWFEGNIAVVGFQLSVYIFESKDCIRQT